MTTQTVYFKSIRIPRPTFVMMAMKALMMQSVLMIAHALAYTMLGPDGALWAFEMVRTFASRGRLIG